MISSAAVGKGAQSASGADAVCKAVLLQAVRTAAGGAFHPVVESVPADGSVIRVVDVCTMVNVVWFASRNDLAGGQTDAGIGAGDDMLVRATVRKAIVIAAVLADAIIVYMVFPCGGAARGALAQMRILIRISVAPGVVRAAPVTLVADAVHESVVFIAGLRRVIQRLAGELLDAIRTVGVLVRDGDHLVLSGIGLFKDVIHIRLKGRVGIGMGAAILCQCGNHRRQAEQQRHRQTADPAELSSEHENSTSLNKMEIIQANVIITFPWKEGNDWIRCIY